MSPLTELPMEVPGERTMYVILSADGRVKGSGSSAGTLYATEVAARRRATGDGDTIVRVKIDLRAEPVFIRRKAL